MVLFIALVWPRIAFGSIQTLGLYRLKFKFQEGSGECTLLDVHQHMLAEMFHAQTQKQQNPQSSSAHTHLHTTHAQLFFCVSP